MTDLDLPGALRRIRRTADMSQRELAGAGQLAPSVIAEVERGHTGVRGRRGVQPGPGARPHLRVPVRRLSRRCYRGPVRGSLLLISRGEALS